MVSEYHAQIFAVFTFAEDAQYDRFFNKTANLGTWYAFMSDVFTKYPWDGVFDEFRPNDESFWDWRLFHEKSGNVVFWGIDENDGEVFAIAFSRKQAMPVYGLQIISGIEEIQSSWR